MPLINVKLIEGVFSPDQKREIIHKLTDTMVSIEMCAPWPLECRQRSEHSHSLLALAER